MATINLGSIKFKWQGAYAGGTAYTVDDVVSYNGSSYICIQASTGNLPTNATYFEQMSSAGTNGTDGTDLTSTLTTQGDLIYRDGSGLQRLGAGTSGQALITGGTGANPSWGTISSGTYSLHDFEDYGYSTDVTTSGATNAYVDIAGGNYVSFTPTSTDDIIIFFGRTTSYSGGVSSGGSIYIKYGTSTSISSSDTSLFHRGTHTNYTGGSGTDHYRDLTLHSFLKCTSLTPSTTYYAEMSGANHNNTVTFNTDIGNMLPPRQYLAMVHYKKN